MKRSIMISGMGIQCAIADSTKTFVSALREGRLGITRIPQEQAYPSAVTIAGLLPNFNLKEQLSKLTNASSELLAEAWQLTQRAPLPIQTSVLTALQAWQAAKLHEIAPPSERIGIVVACDHASQRYQYEMTSKFSQAPEYLSPRYALHALETDHVGVISKLLNLHGEGFAVGGASASGNVAILKASQLIQLNILDACVVIGALSDLSPLALQGYYNSGAMGGKLFKDCPEKACRPFDRDHEGFIYGQGGGCLILEAADSIKRRQIHPLAELLGGVLSLDGNPLPDPSEAGEANVMSACLELAGISPDAVDYINAHGSSSPLGDRTEINAIKRVFANKIDKIWINSTKGLTGHCLFAAGVIEAIACIMQMEHRFIHPNINLHNKIDGACLFAPAKAVPAHITIAMSNSFGFGGINSSLLLRAGHDL